MRKKAKKKKALITHVYTVDLTYTVNKKTYQRLQLKLLYFFAIETVA